MSISTIIDQSFSELIPGIRSYGLCKQMEYPVPESGEAFIDVVTPVVYHKLLEVTYRWPESMIKTWIRSESYQTGVFYPKSFNIVEAVETVFMADWDWAATLMGASAVEVILVKVNLNELAALQEDFRTGLHGSYVHSDYKFAKIHWTFNSTLHELCPRASNCGLPRPLQNC